MSGRESRERSTEPMRVPGGRVWPWRAASAAVLIVAFFMAVYSAGQFSENVLEGMQKAAEVCNVQAEMDKVMEAVAGWSFSQANFIKILTSALSVVIAAVAGWLWRGRMSDE